MLLEPQWFGVDFSPLWPIPDRLFFPPPAKRQIESNQGITPVEQALCLIGFGR